jgi:hypothetical protein
MGGKPGPESRVGTGHIRWIFGGWAWHPETQAMAAGALAIERGVATEQIAAAGRLAPRAAAFNGMPDPVLHLAWAIAHATYKEQSENAGVTEITEVPNRGHSLTIDSGWQEVAQTCLTFIRRFV